MTAPQITTPGTPPDPLAPQPTFRATFYAHLQALVAAFGQANTAFDWVNTTADAVDADAMATEAGRAQAVLKAGEAADDRDAIEIIKGQIDLQEAAVIAATGIDVSAFNFGDLLQVVDVGGGVKGLAMSSQRLERSAPFAGGTPSLNLAAAQFHYGTLTEDAVFTFDVSGFGALSGGVIFFVLEVTQDATLRIITFPASVEWKGGAAPDVPAVGEKAVYTFASRDLGVTWLGTFNGTQFA